MVTFAWFGVDTTFIDGGNGDNGGSGSGGSSGDSSFKFSKVTAGFATGFFGFLTIMVLNSVVYFWRVSTSHYAWVRRLQQSLSQAWSSKANRKNSTKAAIQRWSGPSRHSAIDECLYPSIYPSVLRPCDAATDHSIRTRIPSCQSGKCTRTVFTCFS